MRKLLLRIWNAITGKKKEVSVTPVKTKVTGQITSYPEDKRKLRVAIIKGHNKESQGAWTDTFHLRYPYWDCDLNRWDHKFGKISEFMIACNIETAIDLLSDRLQNEYLVLERSFGSYSHQCVDMAEAIKYLKCDICISLHENKGGGTGFECLIPMDAIQDSKDKLLASSLVEAMESMTSQVKRRQNGIMKLYDGHNGYLMGHMVNAKCNIPFVLFESFFLDDLTHEVLYLIQNPTYMVEIIDKAVENYKREINL